VEPENPSQLAEKIQDYFGYPDVIKEDIAGMTLSEFNAMFVANSIILAAQGLSPSELLAIGLPIVGIILCIVWCSMTIRGFELHDFVENGWQYL